LPEDQNSNNLNNQVPTGAQEPSLNPETTNEQTVAQIPEPAQNTILDTPQGANPPVMAAPDNDKEIHFKPEAIPAESQSQPLPMNSQINPNIQPETNEIVPETPPVPETLNKNPELKLEPLPETKVDSDNSTITEVNPTIPETTSAPLNTVSQPEMHESGHFSSLPGTENVDTAQEEELFKTMAANHTGDSPPPPADVSQPSIAVNNEPAASVTPFNPDDFNASKDKNSSVVKKLVVIGLIVLLIAGLSTAGFFGWVWWQKYNTVKILNAAAANLADGSPRKVDYKIGFNGFSNNGSVSFDADKDFLFSTNIETLPIDLTYIKAENKAYLEGPDNQYIVYTNIEAALSELTTSIPKTDNDGTLSDENTAALKYLKTVGTEDINGVSATHYSFEPTKEFLDKYVNNNENLKKSGVTADILKVEFWVGKEDNKIYKIAMGIEYNMSDTSSVSSGITLDKVSIDLELNFSYNYTDNIQSPTNPNIIQTYDMNQAIDPTNPGSLLPTI